MLFRLRVRARSEPEGFGAAGRGGGLSDDGLAVSGVVFTVIAGVERLSVCGEVAFSEEEVVVVGGGDEPSRLEEEMGGRDREVGGEEDGSTGAKSERVAARLRGMMGLGGRTGAAPEAKSAARRG